MHLKSYSEEESYTELGENTCHKHSKKAQIKSSFSHIATVNKQTLEIDMGTSCNVLYTFSDYIKATGDKKGVILNPPPYVY